MTTCRGLRSRHPYIHTTGSLCQASVIKFVTLSPSTKQTKPVLNSSGRAHYNSAVNNWANSSRFEPTVCPNNSNHSTYCLSFLLTSQNDAMCFSCPVLARFVFTILVFCFLCCSNSCDGHLPSPFSRRAVFHLLFGEEEMEARWFPRKTDRSRGIGPGRSEGPGH